MVLVKISRAQSHLRLFEDIVLFLKTTHLMVFNEQISMLGLSMPTIDFLLEAHHWLVDSHQIVRLRHAVVTRFPRTAIVCWCLIEVILGVSHNTAHFHGCLSIRTVSEVIALLR